jgi:hypothetical protein
MTALHESGDFTENRSKNGDAFYIIADMWHQTLADLDQTAYPYMYKLLPPASRPKGKLTGDVLFDAAGVNNENVAEFVHIVFSKAQNLTIRIIFHFVLHLLSRRLFSRKKTPHDLRIIEAANIQWLDIYRRSRDWTFVSDLLKCSEVLAFMTSTDYELILTAIQPIDTRVIVSIIGALMKYTDITMQREWFAVLFKMHLITSVGAIIQCIRYPGFAITFAQEAHNAGQSDFVLSLFCPYEDECNIMPMGSQTFLFTDFILMDRSSTDSCVGQTIKSQYNSLIAYLIASSSSPNIQYAYDEEKHGVFFIYNGRKIQIHEASITLAVIRRHATRHTTSLSGVITRFDIILLYGLKDLFDKYYAHTHLLPAIADDHPWADQQIMLRHKSYVLSRFFNRDMREARVVELTLRTLVHLGIVIPEMADLIYLFCNYN